MTLTFDNGDVVELAVPVVTQCGQYDGLDDAAGADLRRGVLLRGRRGTRALMGATP